MADPKPTSKNHQRIEDGQTQQFLPEMTEPSPSDAPDLLEEAYEYVKAQEESGFGDPLIGDNCENFDILQYINGGNDTPEGSPSAFCGGGPSVYHQQHQMLGTTASDLVQTLHQTPLHKGTSSTTSVNNCNFQQPMVLDSVGIVMYNNNTSATNAIHNQEVMVTAAGPYGNGSQSGRLLQQHDPRLQKHRQTRLPDSPPITDISAAASSISPGSSGAGCDSVSPYSPDQFHYIHQQPVPQLMNGGILIQHQPNEDLLLVNQMNLMGHNSRRGEGGMLIRSGTVDSQLSPQSEFLSPYPPSQSTPGSQHSSQVSPPAISHPSQNRQPFNYLLQNQPHPSLSIAGSYASTDNLYTASEINGNDGETDTVQQQQFQHHRGQQQGHKRRRMSSSAAPGSHESMPLNNNNILPNVKSEIGASHHQRADSGSSAAGMSQHQSQQQSFEDLDENMNMQKTIKFEPYMRESWAPLYDVNKQQLAMPVIVVADKGFNYSSTDNCFVNQKKNHFQITVNITVNPNTAGSPISQTFPQQLPINGHIHSLDSFTPRYVRVQGRQELLPIINQEFLLAFCGVRSEMPTSEIKIKQSQTDRKPIDHSPVRFSIDGSQNSVKQTVPRLHFSETTNNNHRKNQKPNPEQKYFLLIVKLMANTALGPVLIQAFHSDRVIVRASNPGQFEQPEPDQGWKIQNGALAFTGPVCIGADKPIGDAQLTVHGNVATTGQITRPSDRRVKEDITDLSTTDALDRLSQMRLVEFAYKPEIAEKWGLSEQDRHRVGVIAQELAEVLPEAVKDNGEFLTVDDTRVFYDTVAAAQELYRLTGNLESKIGQVEKISHKLAIYAQKRRQLGSMASGLSDFSTFFGPNTIPPLESKNCISYSRTSLTSTSTANDGPPPPNDQKGNGNKGGRGKSPRVSQHRCRSYSSASAYCSRSAYCHGTETALCSSKFTQGTIITLVFIMALCLVTMCTLYVMDWYNRTVQSNYFPGPSYVHPADPTNQPMSSMLELPPDPEKMIELLDPYWIPSNQNKVPPLSFNCPSNELASIIAGPFEPSCPHYCCAAENNYYERLSDKFNEGVDSLVALASKFPHLFPQSSGTIDEEQIGALGNGAKIDIINLNTTLDIRYCLPENCSTGRNVCIPNSCNPRIGRFNLFVPVSTNLPTIPIQIRFSFNDPTLLIEDCSNFTHFNVCHFQNELQKEDEKNGPRSYRIGDNVFELTAGSFLRSAYKFRVGHSTGLCHLDEKQRGRIFDEYNLVFYRTCAVVNKRPIKNVKQEKAMGGNLTGLLE